MSKEPLFLKPVFQDRIWGGTALRDIFNYDIPSDKTGECWAISAHPNGMGIVTNGTYAGKTLKELWSNHLELFGNFESEQFPLLTKILDANDDLSVQVHPNDEYAKAHENGELGKTECWYIIDCNKDAEIIFGHNAKTSEEVQRMIKAGEWSSFLRRIKIKAGDFFYVPSGTVHALCKGTLVLETQQSSDTTYRLYDYDRTDDQGNKRELHLEKSIDAIESPFNYIKPTIKSYKENGANITTYVQSEFFSVHKWSVNQKATFIQNEPFMLISVLNGEGILHHENKEYPLNKGMHFILPSGFGKFTLTGKLELMVSHV